MLKITPNDLQRIAQEKQKELETWESSNPDGSASAPRKAARKKMEEALVCHEWMVSNGHEALANVGPFMSTSLEKGQSVRVKKGSVIRGTSSRYPIEGKVSKRQQTIVVHRVAPGYLDYYESKPKVKQAAVHWAGADGYWCWTDLNNVEIM